MTDMERAREVAAGLSAQERGRLRSISKERGTLRTIGLQSNIKLRTLGLIEVYRENDADIIGHYRLTPLGLSVAQAITRGED